MSGHPADVDLVGFADDELEEATARAVGRHVRGCARCRDLLGRLLPPLASATDETPRAVPRPLSVAFDTPSDRDPDVGELWRAEWDSAALLVLITGRVDDAYTAVPVTFEEPPDPVAYEIPSDASPVGAALHAWPVAAAELPLGVFLAHMGAVPLAHADPPIRAAPFGAATGLLLAEIIADIAALASARAFDSTADDHGQSPLPDLLRDHRTSAISQATGIPLEVVTGYKRAERTPTPAEAERLGDFLGLPAASLAGRAALPAPLLRAVQRPVHRPRIRVLAAEHAVPEAVMRTRVAEEVLPMAARTTRGERDVAAWDELVSQYLDE